MANPKPLILTDREPWMRSAGSAPQAFGSEMLDWDALGDPYLRQFILGGSETASGARVNSRTAMMNTAVWRSVSLISSAIGMLPLQLINQNTKKQATSHPLYRLLHRHPNAWQSAYDFRSLLQLWALDKGNGYARIIRGVGMKAGQIQALVPMHPDRVTPQQNDDWTITYRYSQRTGGDLTLQAKDVFHLRGLTMDGINGISLVHQAREAIGLALAAERATARLYKNGSFVDGVLQTDKALSDTAYDRLRKSWDERYQGADSAGKTAIMEEGLKYQAIAQSSKDAQSLETRKLQIEEVARVFGVPRPLLMVDETSWGSGVEALGRFFVQYALNPWFAAWEQAVERSLLLETEQDVYSAKFNPGALLRGSMNDQATFFSKALGAGGQQPWFTPNEVRDLFDYPAHPDGDELFNPMTETGPVEPEKDPVSDDQALAPDAPKPAKAHLRAVG